MGSETMQWSILLYLDAKGKFRLGTHGASAYIHVPVRVTMIYHANYPIIAKISTLHPI